MHEIIPNIEYKEVKEYVASLEKLNESDDYTRNKIRHNIVPLLRELNPSVESAVLRMGDALAADADYLENAAKREFEARIDKDGRLLLEGFQKLHTAITMRVLKLFCDSLCVSDVLSSHLNLLYSVALSGGEAQLPGAVFVSESGKLHLKTVGDNTTFSVNVVEVCKNENFDFKKINNLLLKNYIDCDKIVGNLEIRTRNSGDTIKLKNKNGTKPLTKVYNEYRIPVSVRNSLPVISDDNGVVWIYKVGVAERAATDENSKNILKIEVSEDLGKDGNK